jgi:4-amino-4-deoxy-L-arabinose transferase-like glycosyltransferase
MFYRQSTATLTTDEQVNSAYGLEYVHGNLTGNQQHPFLAKYFIGVAQLLLGTERLWVVRLPSALAGLGTGVLLLLFARRVAGFWVGLLAFLLWTVLPHRADVVYGSNLIKIERLAILEPLMVFFMVLALYVGWRWSETGTWKWPLLAGVALGLAVASKATGVLIIPVVVIGAILIRGVSWRSVGQGGGRRWDQRGGSALDVCATRAWRT